MASTLAVLTILPAAIAIAVVVGARSAVQPTSLRYAWGWALAAGIAVAVAWVVTGAWPLVAAPWDDMLWYGVAELLLCPLIAVLGARRPGVAVWNWFVLLPLLAVLGWPVAAAALAGARPGSFTLETPPLIGILLVLVMGVGNYAGTRFWLPVAMVGATVCIVVLPLALTHPSAVVATASRYCAVWLLGGAALLARSAARQHSLPDVGPDRAWQDFRDQFGIVWAQRIRDRINERAGQEKWPARLERQGFVDDQLRPADDAALKDPRIEHALRWLLRRFVDDDWLDTRFASPPSRSSDEGAS